MLAKELNRHLTFILEEYGIELFNKVTLDLSLKGKAAGCAIHDPDQDEYIIRLNLEAGEDFLIKDTLPHEVAHILQAALGSKMDHGRAWEFYCKQLGGTGLMYHELQLTPARKLKEFLYIVNGEQIVLTTIRHNKVQKKGITYSSKRTGNVLDKTHFVRELINE